jgi:hypothetical protein
VSKHRLQKHIGKIDSPCAGARSHWLAVRDGLAIQHQHKAACDTAGGLISTACTAKTCPTTPHSRGHL